MVNRYRAPFTQNFASPFLNHPLSSNHFPQTRSQLQDLHFDFRLTRLFSPQYLQGHPPELSDSVKLLLTDANKHGFEINQVLKSID